MDTHKKSPPPTGGKKFIPRPQRRIKPDRRSGGRVVTGSHIRGQTDRNRRQTDPPVTHNQEIHEGLSET